MQTDDLQVRLTAAGAAHAKGGPVSVHSGGASLDFQPGSSVAVNLAIWTEVLANIHIGGDLLFERVPAATAAPAPATPISEEENDHGTA